MGINEPDKGKTFADLSNEAPQGFFKEVLYLLVSDRRWWLAPIIIAMLILGALVMLSSTGVAPFIYTLF
jgi:hypothetical protein